MVNELAQQLPDAAVDTILIETPTKARDAHSMSIISSALFITRRLTERSSASKQQSTPFYGWFKYREGFSESLVSNLLRELHPHPGVLLDPFAGSGSALFAGRNLGWELHGIGFCRSASTP